MGGADDNGTAAEFLAALGRTLEASGWRIGERTVLELPPRTDPLPESVIQRFDRPLNGGWVARLTVSWMPGSELRLLPPRSYVRHYLHIDGGVTLPAAEELARRCGIDGGTAIPAPPELLPWRGGEDDRRVRGPKDYGPVAGEIAGYAEHALLPWARAHATLEQWLDEWDVAADAPPDPHVDPYADPFADACGIAAMLAVHGRGPDALTRLDAARRELSADDDRTSGLVVERLTAFVETGVLPDPPPDQPAPDQDPDRYVADRTAEDPIRKEFYAGFNAELGEESLGTQWRYFGRQLRSAARMMRALGGDGPSPLTWWAPVAVGVGVEVEELLDRMYEAAGPPVDRRVGLQVELGGRGSGPDDGVDVRIGGDTVGVLRSADIPTWGTVPVLDGARRARLRRKRERPRFLLEVDLG